MGAREGAAAFEPEVMTRGESHDKVVDMFRGKPRGRVLDVPSGQGALALRLKDLGFAVSCCDIDAGLFHIDGIPFRQGNLNERLPYDDASFDYIASIAGIHRVHRFPYAISEFQRILAPGGELVLSFPNYTNMERRIKFLLTGTASKVVNVMGFHEHHTDDPDAHFRQLLTFPQVYFALRASTFTVTGMAGDKLKYKSLALLPMWLLIKAVQKAASARNRERLCLDWMSSFTMLFGANNLIITAKKAG